MFDGASLDPKLWFAAIVESSDDAILSKTLDSIILTWNAGAERLFGYSAQEAIGQSVTILIPEDRLSEEDHIIGRLRAGERVEHFETVRRHKDGSLIDVSLTISPVRNAGGEIIGASKIARDITELTIAGWSVDPAPRDEPPHQEYLQLDRWPRGAKCAQQRG